MSVVGGAVFVVYSGYYKLIRLIMNGVDEVEREVEVNKKTRRTKRQGDSVDPEDSGHLGDSKESEDCED